MSTTGGPWSADSWIAIAPFGASILCVFITPPKETQTLQPGRPRIAVEARRSAPSESRIGLETCNIHKCLRRTGRVGHLALLERRPRLPFPFADLSCIAPHDQSAERGYVRRAVVFPSSSRSRD